jgi:flagellar biosynthetic protein FliP
MNQPLLPLLLQGVKATEVSSAVEIVFLLTLLSLGPAVLIVLTSFTRIVVVLSFLRQAMGTQQAPSNQIIIALALFVSLYVMAPVWQQIETNAVTPYLQQQIGPQEALSQAWDPLREFLLRQTRKADLALFVQMQHEREQKNPQTAPTSTSVPAENGQTPATVSPAALIPAYVISELKTAFQIAFLIYVPFLVLDLVVAAILMSMGMMFLPPALISLPFKLVLFVLVDGWNLLVGSLVRSFV